MNQQASAPEVYPGIYFVIGWLNIALLAGLGGWYAAARNNTPDFAQVMDFFNLSPYPLLAVLGVLVLLVTVPSGSVQRTMGTLATVLDGRPVERHMGLFFLGALVKLCALAVTAWLAWQTWTSIIGDRISRASEEQVLSCTLVLVLVALLGAWLFALGALMTAQSWIGGAADSLAAERRHLADG